MVIRSYKASGSVDHVQFTFHRYTIYLNSISIVDSQTDIFMEVERV